MRHAKKDGPNPLEVLGLSLRLVRDLKDRPERLLDIVKSHYRTLSFAYHPDQNPGDPEAEGKFGAIAIAWAAVDDKEKMARAIKRFLETGAEHMSLVYQLKEVKDELAARERQFTQKEAEVRRLEAAADLSERVYERLVPGATADPPGVHIVNSSSLLVLTEAPERTQDEKERWSILWVDFRQNVFSQELRIEINAEVRVHQVFEETRQQLMEAVANAQPLRQYWHPQGHIFGSFERAIDAEKDIFEPKEVDREVFSRFLATVRPYIIVGQHLLTARIEIAKFPNKPPRISVMPRTLGVVREVRTLTGRSPTGS